MAFADKYKAAHFWATRAVRHAIPASTKLNIAMRICRIELVAHARSIYREVFVGQESHTAISQRDT